jgi:protein involved in polysaccharide export with SLBB domain
MRDRMGRTTSANLCQSWRRPIGWIIMVAMLANPLLVLGQVPGSSASPLKAGDILKLLVPGRPDLDAEMVIDANGRAEIPQVGEVALAGLTVSEANLFIKQKLRLFHPNIDALRLEVRSASATKIYVIGQVSRPGVQSFEHIPSVWDVLRSAGGPAETADLRGARVIREDGELPQVFPVDLSGIMDGRSIPRLVLRNGDTLVVPALLEGTSGVPSAEGVKVFGGVQVSTIVPIQDPMPMLDVLMLAGAPSENADMKKIYWVHEQDGHTVSTQVNLLLYLRDGYAIGNPTVYPGDTLHVKVQKDNWFWRYVPPIMGIVAGVLAILLTYDRLVNGYPGSF